MDFKNQKAIYLQIADHICSGILAGEHNEGDKLPSVREYAAQMEVNVNTMARSLEWLQMHEVVESRRGMGNYVSEGALSKIEAIRKEEFFTEQLPELFQSMRTLGISMDEINKQYNEYIYEN